MKLSEIESTKGKKDYYTVDEVLGNEFEIIENILPDTEIRTRETKEKYEYFLIGIRYDAEKDLSLRKAPLLAIAEALPKNESWKGYKLVLNRSGRDKSTAYKVTVKGRTLEKAFEKPQDAQAPSQTDKIKAMLDKIAGYTKMQMTVNDAGLEYIANEVCGTKESGQFMIAMLKQSGKITKNGQGWTVT